MPLPRKAAKKAEPASVINFPQKYYVIGADLGLKRPGFCKLTVENTESGKRLTDISLMSVDNKNDRKKPHGELLNEIMNAFSSFIPDTEKEGVPCFYIREKEIMDRKLPSERDISKVVGLTDWLLWRMGESWRDIYPVTIKKYVAGSGRADKSAVAESLPYYIGSLSFANDDESDAAAVAVAWLLQQGEIKPKPGKEEEKS